MAMGLLSRHELDHLDRLPPREVDPAAIDSIMADLAESAHTVTPCPLGHAKV
jgi:hypothetical protein